MSLRESINANPALTSVLAVTLLLAAVAIALYASGVFGGSRLSVTDKSYFYDMQTRQLFAAKATFVPPIEAPSGGEGVLAQVYGCGDCTGERVIGLLRKYTPSAKLAIESGRPPDPDGQLVRLPHADSAWVSANSPQGQKMRLTAAADVYARCQGKEPRPCFPKRNPDPHGQ
jgi:hypothetical protein